MKNEMRFALSVTGLNLPAKKQWRQAKPVKTDAKVKTWRIPPSAQYRAALRDADEAVTRFILEHTALTHHARTARFARN